MTADGRVALDQWNAFKPLYELSLLETIEFKLANDVKVEYLDRFVSFLDRNNNYAIFSVHGSY